MVTGIRQSVVITQMVTSKLQVVFA